MAVYEVVSKTAGETEALASVFLALVELGRPQDARNLLLQSEPVLERRFLYVLSVKAPFVPFT